MLDFEKIKTIYKIGKDLEWKDLQSLIQATTSRSYAINDYLIKEGTVKREVFFIKKGLIRVFAINDKGDEITIRISTENQPIASPDIILFDQPSRFYFQALEPTETLSIDYDLMQKVISKTPALEQNRKNILLNILKESQARVESFVLYSPEERYIRFVEDNPGIVNRVPDKYIANVLGITPVSLSRIRKRIVQKKK